MIEYTGIPLGLSDNMPLHFSEFCEISMIRSIESGTDAIRQACPRRGRILAPPRTAHLTIDDLTAFDLVHGGVDVYSAHFGTLVLTTFMFLLSGKQAVFGTQRT